MQVNAGPAVPGVAGRFSMAEVEPDIYWQAMQTRDPRFDGRFFVAAVTTGIYCRSVCPVPFAKRNNIALFSCAAAAEAAGFRPCRRCRPETAPGTPAWGGTSAAVSRALRLIWDGALDTGNVEGLAARVGIGSRHLRRLFLQHLGAPPIKIAATHRLHFARSLIEQTDMPMAEIALNSGFNSIRQFNHAVLTTSGESPSMLRRARRNLGISSQSGELTLRLPYRPPFHWRALISFLRSRATPGVELVTPHCYRRTVETDGGAGVLDIRPDPGNACLILRIRLPKYEGLLPSVERVRRLFDLGADTLQIETHLSRDGRLKPRLARRPGLRVPGVWDGFEVAVRAALGQRLTFVDSDSVAAELVQKFGRPLDTPIAGLTHLFPRPEDLATADVALCGISRKRAALVNALASKACKNELTFESPRSLQETISRLSAIDGICDGMAHYIAMRAFSEPDAFPVDDWALIHGLYADKPALERTLDTTETWCPWRSYAAMHLWAANSL